MPARMPAKSNKRIMVPVDEVGELALAHVAGGKSVPAEIWEQLPRDWRECLNEQRMAAVTERLTERERKAVVGWRMMGLPGF